jgi:hypothetical protein
LKYKIDCKSLLLQKALEEFLKEYISEDGIVISDENGDIIIGKDIKKPFSKSQLLIQLESLNQKHKIKETIKEHIDLKEEKEELEIEMDIFDDLLNKDSNNENIEHHSFEKKLDILIDEFSNKLKQLIKEEYGKK